MILFVAVLLLLFLVSLIRGGEWSFGKDKMLPLKAVLALLIVADHLTFSVDAAWLMPFRKWGAPIVSLFFFISGYGLDKSYLAKGEKYLQGFFKRRMLKVIVPALIVFGLYCLICWKSHDVIAEVRNWLVYGSFPLPNYWFVGEIIFMYIAFWLSFKCFSGRWKQVVLLVLTAVLTVVPILIGYDRCWWVGTFAFPAGVLFSEYESAIKDRAMKSLWSYSIAVGICLALVFLLYISNNQYLFIGCYISIPVCLALVLGRLKYGAKTCSVISFLGNISYEIFLCQCICIEFLRSDRVFIHSDILFILAVYAMVIVLAYVANRLTKILLK